MKRSDFQPLIDKVAKKLAGWQGLFLSNAGRLVLVKAVLSFIPTYQMLAVNQPAWVLKQIDKLQRSFLWSGKDNASGAKSL